MATNIQWFDPALGSAVVAFSKLGLTFNRAAVAQLGSPAYVQVGVDPKARTLIVRACKGADQGRAPERALAFWKEGQTNPFVRLTSRDLMRFIRSAVPEVPLADPVRFAARLDPDSGDLIVDLKQPLASRARRRAKEGG
ncbi:MAG: hypothetical protein K6U08_05565 [Firmicutes bacterium]|nr:hypothetical protein [Bacillota bacterium]